MGTEMKSVEMQFATLCERAMMAYGEEFEISYEQALLDILRFVKAHPKFRSFFVEKFKLILCSRDSPFEAVAFCMRELQWEEIQSFALQELNASQDCRSESLLSVITAYDEIWPDEDIYEYYSAS